MIDLAEYSKIVIIQTAFIGDTALSLYFAQQIKNNYPNIEIAFVCTPVSADIISAAECIDKCIPYDKRKNHKGVRGIKAIANEVNSWGAELVFALHRSLRSTVLAKLIKAKQKIGFSNSALSIIYDKTVKYYPNLHEIDRNAELLAAVKINTKEKFTNIRFKKNPVNTEIQNLIDELQNTEAVMLAPGSVWETKKWLPEYFRRTAEMLRNSGYRVIISGSAKERELCDYIAEGTNAINTAGKANLYETIKLMQKCRLVICNDSAPTHLATLANRPVITIYGATSPMFGFYPIGQNSCSIINHEVACTPCLIHGSNECPLGHLKCMKGITPESVVQKAITTIRKIGYFTS